MRLDLPIFPYGGDYNPEQWPREVWDEDVRLMGEANWNIATLPVFGWAKLEPEDGRYDFEWLDDIVERLHAGGVRICMATATASVPAWLPQVAPDVLVVGENGIRRKHGNRHTFCPNSAAYRRKSTELARALAERYGKHPALLMWHVNNEYGTYCYCDQCAAAFRTWLHARYGSLEELNARWCTAFWGHTFTDWKQIETPTTTGEGAIQALKIDYHRFQSDSLLNCFRAEAAVLREITPDIPITTNLMGTFFPLDYREWAKEMDIVSWDNYPYYDADYADVAFGHALMRGLKEGQPFLLMEQSPSQQNWAPYNRLKPPGELSLQSFQAVAHGADSVMYFQWRRGRGGIEKLHGAVMEHGGSSQNRVFRDVAQLGGDLKRVGSALQGARVPAKVAVLFDWPNWWGLRFSSGPSKDLDYNRVVRDYYGSILRLGIEVEVVSPDADLSPFDVIVAPLLTMITPEAAARIEARVRAGATFVATAFSGLVNDTDVVYLEGAPGPLGGVLGVWVEETDALPPDDENEISWSDGTQSVARLLADRVHLRGATTVAQFTKAFFAGEPAVTRHAYEAGVAYYVATYPDAVGRERLFRDIFAEKGIESALGLVPPEGVETVRRRSSGGVDTIYVLNHLAESAELPLPHGTFVNLLTGTTVAGYLELPARGVAILTPQE